MSLFKDMLGAGESIFKNEDALDPEWIPKLIPHREQQQHHIATCIKPLMQGRNGRNLFVYGEPGIGKTVATRWVLRDLEDNTDDVYTLYVNCWQKNTTYKVFMELCHQLDYKFTQNKNIEELFNVIKSIVNKKGVVFVFDEVDKTEDLDFLYSILNDVYKKTVILITNYKEWLDGIEERVRSRYMPELLEFKPYTPNEIADILQERCEYAFTSNVWDPGALQMIVNKASELKDVRAGHFLLRQAGLVAEEVNSRAINLEHTHKALEKLQDFTLKKSTDLEEDTRLVLKVVKEHSGERIGELYKKYKEMGGEGVYKTFQRRIEKLQKAKFITTNKVMGGKEGTTTHVSSIDTKKLTEF